MSIWQFALDDGASNPLADLEATATGRKLIASRNSPDQVAFTLNMMDDTAGLLMGALGGIPRLRVYQDATIRFHGVMAALQESADGSDATVACTFQSPFWRLLGDGSATGRITASGLTYTALDAGAIAKALIDAENAASETGIDTTGGSIQTTTARTITYDRKNVGQAIIDLSQMSPGFDFETVAQEDPGTGKLVHLNIWAAQGSTRAGAIFQHGPGTVDNVLSVTRTTQPPANHIYVIGGSNLVGEASNAGSIAAYGLWPQTINQTDLTDQTALNARASDYLRPNPVRVVGFSPDPASAPVPFVDYGIGDTVTLHCDRDNLQIDAQVRIDGIAVTLDDNGLETAHDLTVEEV